MQRKTQWGTRWGAVLVTAVALALIGWLSRPSSVAAQTYVIDEDAGTGFRGALFRVDPTTGARTLLSDFGVGANPGDDPVGVAVEPAGSILVIDPRAGTGFRGALFRVDPTTGARTLLSDFGVGANPGVNPFGVAVSAAPAGIPTLSEWAQIGMAALLVGGGLLALRKRSAV